LCFAGKSGLPGHVDFACVSRENLGCLAMSILLV
jgi:hypothetical protein